MQVKTKSVTFNVVDEGSRRAPVLMLSNSLAANLEMWQPQVAALARDYRIIRYDTRGHGASAVPAGPYTFGQLTGDVIALLDALEIDRVHFAGLSLGGMTALGLGIHHADRLLSITAACCGARAPAAAAAMWDERIQVAETQGMQALVEPTIERWFTAPMRAARAAEVAPVRAMIADTPVAGYAGCGAALKDLDYLDLLARIKLPTLFIVGTHDAAVPVATMQDMQARVAGSRLVELAGAHLANIECADEFNQALGEFLRGCAQSARG